MSGKKRAKVAAFEEMRFLLACWYGASYGSSTIPSDEEVLGVLYRIADEFKWDSAGFRAGKS